MSKMRSWLLGLLAVSCLLPVGAQARAPRSAACSVSIDYLLNTTLRSAYQKDFVVEPGVVFEDDFSTAVRFRYLDAWSTVAADGKTTTVSIAYYNDIGVLDFIDLRTEVTLDDKDARTSTGQSSYWSSVGIAGEHITKYTLTCHLLDD